MAELPNVVPALPELFLALVILALLMFGVFQKGGAADLDAKTTRLISYLSIIALVLAQLVVTTLSGGRLVTC